MAPAMLASLAPYCPLHERRLNHTTIQTPQAISDSWSSASTGRVLEDYQLLTLAQTRYLHPSSNITLLVANASEPALADYKRLLAGLDIQVAPFPSLRRPFRYRHSSTNSLGYEEFCFQRHLALARYATAHGVQALLHHDLDIVVYRPFWGGLLQEFGLFSLARYGSFFTHWRLPMLQEWGAYVHSFYDRTDEQLAEHISRAGGPPPDGMRAPHWWPEHLEPKLFSDMYLLMEFVRGLEVQGRLVLDPKMPPPVVAATSAADNAAASGASDSSSTTSDPRTWGVPLETLAHVVESGLLPPFMLPLASLRTIMQDCRPEEADQLFDKVKVPIFVSGEWVQVKVPVFDSMELLGVHFQGDCKERMCLHMCEGLSAQAAANIDCCTAAR